MNKLSKVAMMMALPVLLSASTPPAPELKEIQLRESIRKELVTLPFLTIFDNLQYKVDDGRVTLLGQTIRPTIRSSAENVVKRLNGVTSVDNQIEVLPLSPYDDRLRLAVTRAVYGFGPLQRYQLGAQPSIRIIVKNGEVTLAGVVANEFDRNVAFVRANGVSGAFKVTNQLVIEGQRTL